MKWAYTGSRPPDDGFSEREVERIHEDVWRTVQRGDLVATGGCVGVDAIVMQATRLAACRVIVMLPADRSRVDEAAVASLADVVIAENEGHLARNRRLVEWADKVAAISLVELRDPVTDKILDGRGGTRFTARYAQRLGKLDHVTVLRA